MRLNYDVALNQPAYQLSTFPNMFPYLAVSGCRNGSMAAGTNNGTNNWWAVDLGRMTYVANVTITPDPKWSKLAELQIFRLVSCFRHNVESKPFSSSNFSNCINLI